MIRRAIAISFPAAVGRRTRSCGAVAAEQARALVLDSKQGLDRALAIPAEGV